MEKQQDQSMQKDRSKNQRHIINILIVSYLTGILLCAIFTAVYLNHIVEKFTISSQNSLNQHLYSSRNINIISSIDSCGIIKPYDKIAMTPETHNIIIDQSVAKLTEHNRVMAESSKEMMNIIVLWGSILTLMSVIFTFLGYLEVRSKIKDVEQQKKKLEEFIQTKQTAFEQDISTLEGSIQEKISALESHTKETEQLHRFYINMFDSLHRSRYTTDQIDVLGSLLNDIEHDCIITQKNEKNELLAKCYYYLGRMYDRLPTLEKAIESYTKSINYHDKDGFVYYNRAIDYLENNNIDGALEDLNTSLSINPTDMSALYRLGNIYTIKNETDKAIIEYRKAENAVIKTDIPIKIKSPLNQLIDDKLIVGLRDDIPNIVNILLIRGHLFEINEEHEKALNDYENALEKSGENEQLKTILVEKIKNVKGKQKITIRLEKETDHAFVENLTREAFWDMYHPGATEHLVLHKLRKVPAFIPELDFVAVQKGQVVGHIAYSKAKVIDPENQEHVILCAGPLSVSPELQRQGIGSRLIEHTKTTARELGYTAIALFGNPDYYQRFGFRNAAHYHITTPGGENFDAFMICELVPGGLSGINGKYHEDPVFNVTEEELDEFEKRYPYKEKHVTDTQLKE